MYVEINPPNSRHSLPRNHHIASLLLLSPVVVSGWPCASVNSTWAPWSVAGPWSSGAGVSVSVASDTGELLGRLSAATLGRRVVVAVGRGRRLERPAVRRQQQDGSADDSQHL